MRSGIVVAGFSPRRRTTAACPAGQEAAGKSPADGGGEGVDVVAVLFWQVAGIFRAGRDRSGDHRHAAAGGRYGAASGRSRLRRIYRSSRCAAAIKGLPLKAYMFIQTRLSFTLVGQPGMTPARMRNIAVSGIGSLAHTAAITVARRLGRDGPTTRSSTLPPTRRRAVSRRSLAKAADAAILTPPYTSMATLAGYVDLGNTFDVRDLQGGIVGAGDSCAKSPRADESDDPRRLAQHGADSSKTKLRSSLTFKKILALEQKDCRR